MKTRLVSMSMALPHLTLLHNNVWPIKETRTRSNTTIRPLLWGPILLVLFSSRCFLYLHQGWAA